MNDTTMKAAAVVVGISAMPMAVWLYMAIESAWRSRWYRQEWKKFIREKTALGGAVMKKIQAIRQGDIVLKMRDAIPTGLKLVKLPNVVLAEGETTGHKHQVVMVADRELEQLEGYLKAHADETGEWKREHHPIQALGITPRPATDEEAELFADEARTDLMYLMVKAKKAVVLHEEHWPLVVTAGVKEITRQREYDPETDQRYVID